MIHLLWQGTLETLGMSVGATIIAVLVGVPLGVLLVLTHPQHLWPHRLIHHSLGVIINGLRSIPYIVLIVFLMPLTRVLVGTTIGTVAAMVPLSIAGSLLVARQVQGALFSVPRGLIDVGVANGATTFQITYSILLVEALPTIVSGLTTVTINLIGFSAMAGAVGGGGLGDLAIRYGYQRYDMPLMLIIVCILIALVQCVQMLGDFWAKRLQKWR